VKTVGFFFHGPHSPFGIGSRPTHSLFMRDVQPTILL
jgi:hypothetical protein